MLDRTDHNAPAAKRFGIGGNQPPSAIDLAKETATALGTFLKDHPVISTEDAAREAKLLKDRADNAVRDLEDERDRQVRPLNEQVAAINATYRPSREPLKKIIDELKARLTGFAKAEEAKRQAAAEAARRAAAEAERIAREAEQREREAQEEAAQGVLDADIAQATMDADAAFSDFKLAERQAARAEREAHVRIGGGFGRVATLRTHEVLAIVDVHLALDSVGLSDGIRDALLTAARAFRKEFGELPDGIEARQERSI